MCFLGGEIVKVEICDFDMSEREIFVLFVDQVLDQVLDECALFALSGDSQSCS